MTDTKFHLAGKRVWVAGHRGMVGSALVRRLAEEDCTILSVDRSMVDLRQQDSVYRWVAVHRPQVVFVAAGLVGGIQANLTRPAEFIHDNLVMAATVIDAAHKGGVEKLMFLGSSCVYPRLCAQPMGEDALLSGPLEPTNEPYAIAKLAGISLCRSYRSQYGCDFISVIPANLYGPGDNLDPDGSHVVAALIRKVLEAKRRSAPLQIWGTGSPRREFLFVDDAADAMVFLMKHYSHEKVINIGAGVDLSIRELAELIARTLDFHGRFEFDSSKPDGMPRKQLDARRLIAMGWRPKTDMAAGMAATCQWIDAMTKTGVLP